jgi:hypothetical protein
MLADYTIIIARSTTATAWCKFAQFGEAPTPIREALEALVEHGLDGMAEAMKIERTGDRRGYANAFKPKQM